jgi:type III secretion protein L
MKQLFALLSEKKVALAPGKKVISKDDFTTLHEASELLSTVRREALAFTQQSAKEAETIKEAAFQEGFQEGLVSLNAHLLQLDKELQQIREDVQKRILPLSLKAAKKIIGEELKLHPDRIVDIVITSLKPVTQHRKVAIYVNSNDLEVLESRKADIKSIFEHLDSFALQARDDVLAGGCIIETEAGIINAQLENQWRALETAFESFMKK